MDTEDKKDIEHWFGQVLTAIRDARLENGQLLDLANPNFKNIRDILNRVASMEERMKRIEDKIDRLLQ